MHKELRQGWGPMFESKYGLAWGCLPWQPRIASAPHGAGEAMAYRSPCTLAGPRPWWVGCYYGHVQVGLPCWSPPSTHFFIQQKKKKKTATSHQIYIFLFWSPIIHKKIKQTLSHITIRDMRISQPITKILTLCRMNPLSRVLNLQNHKKLLRATKKFMT